MPKVSRETVTEVMDLGVVVDRHICRLGYLNFQRMLQFGNRTILTVDRARTVDQSDWSAAEVTARFEIAATTLRGIWCGQR